MSRMHARRRPASYTLWETELFFKMKRFFFSQYQTLVELYFPSNVMRRLIVFPDSFIKEKPLSVQPICATMCRYYTWFTRWHVSSWMQHKRQISKSEESFWWLVILISRKIIFWALRIWYSQNFCSKIWLQASQTSIALYKPPTRKFTWCSHFNSSILLPTATESYVFRSVCQSFCPWGEGWADPLEADPLEADSPGGRYSPGQTLPPNQWNAFLFNNFSSTSRWIVLWEIMEKKLLIDNHYKTVYEPVYERFEIIKNKSLKITYHLIYMIDISFKQHLHLLLPFTQFHLFFEHISKDDCPGFSWQNLF